jgi:hypothetical protein
MNKKWKIIGRHRDIEGCVITESHLISSENELYVRFVATILGWRNFNIYEGYAFDDMLEIVENKVRKR